MDEIQRVLKDIMARLKKLEGVTVIKDLDLPTNGSFSPPKAAADPSGTNGDIYYNTSTNKFRGYAAGAWVDLH